MSVYLADAAERDVALADTFALCVRSVVWLILQFTLVDIALQSMLSATMSESLPQEYLLHPTVAKIN